MSKRRVFTGTVWRGRGLTDITPSSGISYDWSDSNLPSAYTSSTQSGREAEYFANWPVGWPSVPTIVNIQTGAATFRENVLNTIAANGRCIIRLGEGTYHLTAFVKAASDEMYAFGLWHTNLAGFVGQGHDKTFIQMDANSMNSTQLAGIATLTSAQINSLNVLRLDGDATSPAVLCGLTIQSEDQQTIASFAAGNNIVGGQPAPHGGVMWYRRGAVGNILHFYCSHVRALGAARACTSLPPFEHANFSSQNGHGYYFNVESDGRRSADLNPAQPRRCGVIMGNNEYTHYMKNCWLHHTNVSRYAVNDQNSNTSGAYTVERSKVEYITDTHNVDPALNGGSTLGGYTNATCFGWETCNGTISVHDCIIAQQNTLASGQVPCHFQMTTVGTGRGTNGPQGGRFYAYNNTYRHSVPQLDGYQTYRVATATYWYLDGFATTIDSRVTEGGAQKTAWTYTGTRFPSASEIAVAGLSPSTHYIVNLV